MKFMRPSADGTPRMQKELYRYQIYPLTFAVGKPATFTIVPQGKQSAFDGAYRIAVHRIDIVDHQVERRRRARLRRLTSPHDDMCAAAQFEDGETFIGEYRA